jgi:hypothetical protein
LHDPYRFGSLSHRNVGRNERDGIGLAHIWNPLDPVEIGERIRARDVTI